MPCVPGGNLQASSVYLADANNYAAMLDSLSTRRPGTGGRTGHDQFFTAFGRWAFKPGREGDMLAEVMDRLARENTLYLEVMATPQGDQARALGAQVGWKDDPAAMRRRCRRGLEA